MHIVSPSKLNRVGDKFSHDSFVVHCVKRCITRWKQTFTVECQLCIWPSIKFDHGSTSRLSCLFDCCSVACGCRDRCGRNNFCRKSRICVWSLVCWSCCSPFCRPFFLLLHSQLLFPYLEVSIQSASPHHHITPGAWQGSHWSAIF